MCLRQSWMIGAVALSVLSGAAEADVTVSQSNGPSGGLDGEMRSLLGTEKLQLRKLPPAQLAALAAGPERAAAAAKAPAVAEKPARRSAPAAAAVAEKLAAPDMATVAPAKLQATARATAVARKKPAQVAPVAADPAEETATVAAEPEAKTPEAKTAVAKTRVKQAAAGTQFGQRKERVIRASVRKAPAPVVPVVHYSDSWLATLPAPAGDAQWQCLTQALYFEARGESLKGQFAVAEVILNRVDSPAYPSTVCGVVGQRGGGSCQFSYVCDGRADTMRERGALERAKRIARVMLDGAPRQLTDGATHFHTRGVRPGWAHRFPRTAAIGAHLFYRQPRG